MEARPGVDDPGDDRDPRLQAELAGGRLRQPSDDVAGTDGRRDLRARHAEAIQLAGGRERLAGQEARRRAARHSERQEVPRREVPARRGGDLRLVALDPEGGWEAGERPAGKTGRGGELGPLRAGPGVLPDDRVAGRPALGVDRDERRPVAVESNRQHIRLGSTDEVPDRRRQGPPPGIRILLGAPRRGVGLGPVAGSGQTEQPAIERHEAGLHLGRP